MAEAEEKGGDGGRGSGQGDRLRWRDNTHKHAPDNRACSAHNKKREKKERKKDRKEGKIQTILGREGKRKEEFVVSVSYTRHTHHPQ